jgi:hypothetical protein
MSTMRENKSNQQRLQKLHAPLSDKGVSLHPTASKNNYAIQRDTSYS